MLIPFSEAAYPVVKTAQDCADFSKTVAPFLWDTFAAPDQVGVSLSAEGLKQWYIHNNPVATGLAISIALFPIFLIVSEINKNYSQVDRVWSILPTVFNAHFAIWARLSGLPTQRVDNVLAFSMLWSIRLTFNYWRKGGYEIGSEDYRWLIIKKRIGSVGFFLLNLLFISSLQILILFAVSTPTYVLLLTSTVEDTWTLTDAIFARGLIALVVVEYFADQQMWNYQQAKKSYQATAKVPDGYTRAQMDRGFCTTGLWKYCRHPNFAAEQTIWLVLYQWGCWQSNTYANWTFAGAMSYLAVFQGSTPLTERISASKYPEYKIYMDKVGKFFPKPGKGWDEAEMETQAPKLAKEEEKKEEASKKKEGAKKRKK